MNDHTKGGLPMTVRFHLPDFRNNYPLNMLLITMLKKYPKYFRENIEIASIFGEFPTSLWNGGRFNGGDQCDATYIKEVIKHVNALGIPIRYTYTNPLLIKEDLVDAYCNFCMKAADNGLNEVLVVSPLLESYIRKHYPNFKISSSTCKEIKDIDTLNQELEKDYNLVVLDYNLNNQFDILEKITHKEKCELLVNSCCIPNCKRRAEHYKDISRRQRTCLENRKLSPNKQKSYPVWKCEYGEINSLYKIKDYSTHISPDDIWAKYVPLGFSHFKIEGRTANLFSLIDTYCYYFMKPEFKDEGRLMLIANLEVNKIITINKPTRRNWT